MKESKQVKIQLPYGYEAKNLSSKIIMKIVTNSLNLLLIKKENQETLHINYITYPIHFSYINLMYAIDQNQSLPPSI